MHESELQSILQFIRLFTDRHGFPPSYAEIAEHCGLGSVGHVQYRVNRLVRDGRVMRSPGRARSLQVVAESTLGRERKRIGALFEGLRKPLRRLTGRQGCRDKGRERVV